MSTTKTKRIIDDLPPAVLAAIRQEIEDEEKEKEKETNTSSSNVHPDVKRFVGTIKKAEKEDIDNIVKNIMQ
jgi:hypothetical protein